MTYAETRPSIYSTTTHTIVPPPRTPVGPSMDNKRNGGMMIKKNPNSLDFWSKTEDQNSGITCYYSRHDMRFPSHLVNRSSKQQQQQQNGRPSQMNGSSSSSSSAPSSAPSSSRLGSPRYPPFPASSNDIMSPSPPPPGIYRNVPIMPRAKLNTEGKRSSVEKKKDGNVVWGSGRKEEWNEDGGTSAVTPLNPYNASNEKKRSNRRKPRWTRCMQTLFCCVTPPREIEKIQSNNQRTNGSSIHVNGRSTAAGNAQDPPIQLITQVHRDGTVSGLPNGSNNLADNTQSPFDRHNIESNIIEKSLLPPLSASDSNRKCLVIDLDETLVHSSFKPVKNPDFVIPVEIDGVEHQVYVLKRPYVDEFLAKVGEMFECILFTASLAKYADPVADLLDKKGVFRGRLFREACVFHKGNYVKDLSRLGRDLNQTLIIDNSPASYAFHPENAVPVTTWFDDPSDRELLDILSTLEQLNEYPSVYDCLRPEEGPTSDALLLEHCSC